MKRSERQPSVLRQQPVDELRQELIELKKEAFNLRFQKANMTQENPMRSRWVRRKIALINTILHEKKREAA